ncbi:MAG: AAA family ATPase [Dehalococcoidia bacterium]|nr:AAA family ATPase [Dehalococcoidia bacterium]
MNIPKDKDAEEAVIGSLLIDGDSITQVVYSLKPSDFFYDANKMIYAACVSIFERHTRINQITIAQELDSVGKLKDAGGAAYLSELISICPTSVDIADYAEIVRNLSAHRALIELGGEIQRIGGEPNSDSVERLMSKVKDYQTKYMNISEFITPKESGNIVFDLISKYNDPLHGLKWGFRDLDDITAGLYPGELVIVGARPRIGKTQLMIDVAQNLYDKKILFVSAEMTVEHILERRVARELGIPIKQLRKYGLNDDQMDKITDVSGKVSEWGITFLHPGVSSMDVYHAAIKLKDTVGLDIVFIDYLQKLKDCYGEKEREDIRIGRACQRIKDIAVELNIPVVCASQFNRNQEYRSEDDRTPVISDLRGSGSIEQDADVILLLWRDNPTAPELNIRMAKSRQVEPGDDIKLVWKQDERRYADYSDRGNNGSF